MNTPYIDHIKAQAAALRAKCSTVRHQLPTLALVGVAALSLFSSCMEEALPSTGYTQGQLNNSPRAKEASFWAIPARYTQLEDKPHRNFGWGTLMHMRDLFTADLPTPNSNFNQWAAFNLNIAQGQDYTIAGYTYSTIYGTILTANTCIRSYANNITSDADRGFLAAAYAFRATSYLDGARMYEFLPNDAFPDGKNSQGNVITGLTLPIITEQTTQAQSYNNPRATHEEMFQFILSDLDKAEEHIDKLTSASKDLPHLDVVYGLKARLYLWDGQYDKAAEFARKAINAHQGTPTTQAQWLDKQTGFNTPVQSWMMSVTLNSQTLGESNLVNWTAHLSPEATYGYAGAGDVYPMIDRALYDKIADTDFRKLSFKAPKGHALEGKTPFINDADGATFPTYTSVKFRPGSGETEDFKIASVGSYPLMRVEEMYLIEAEAVAHTNAAQGLALLNTFMQTYRDKNYNFTDTNTDKLVQEIILQKRIEFWGEGLTFFDIKRLNMPVTRAYAGTNWPASFRFNTPGRPAWMNIVLSKFEGTFNTPVFNYNNPDPSNKYSAVR